MKSLRDYIKDGWMNLISSIGTSKDKRTHTTFDNPIYLDKSLLTAVWIGDGYGAKIVSAPADDMTREWITITNDDENKISNKLKDLDSPGAFNLALKWSRLFGGGVILMGIADGLDLVEPVNENKIKDIHYLRVYDRSQIDIRKHNYDLNPLSPTFGELETITIIPVYGEQFVVHVSRCLIFKGIPVPNRETTDDVNYWGMSVLQQIWDQLRDFNSAFASVSTILQELIIGKYTLVGLAELMASGQEQLVRDRVNIIEMSKSVINAVLLDGDEKYERDAVSLGGIPETLYAFMMFLSGVSGIPVTRLFGRSAAGMNATGENDLMNYYDMIKSSQENKLQKQLQRLVDYINVNEKIVDPTIKFKPLIQTTQKEEIDMRKTQADIDNMYMNTGVLLPEEIRDSRFSNGYSFETNLLEEVWIESEEEKEEMKQAMINNMSSNNKEENKEETEESENEEK